MYKLPKIFFRVVKTKKTGTINMKTKKQIQNLVLFLIGLFFILTNSCKTEEPLNLPTVTTELKTSLITANSAMSGGVVIDDKGETVTTRGVCWSTSIDPTIKDSITKDGAGAGSYTSNLKNLLPNTSYYVRAYATNKSGTAFGNSVQFTTTADFATLITTPISLISKTTASGGGNIVNDGNSTITMRGICWSTNTNPTINNNKTLNGSGKGIFESILNNLSPGTNYYVRAYATNSKGTSYGDVVNFTSTIDIPTLTTNSISSITGNSAIGGGNIINNGGSLITTVGVCWSTNSNPTTSNNKTTNNYSNESFENRLTNLSALTKYYIRAYAINNAGTAYGNEITFTTSAIVLPVITTSSITNILGNSASSGGVIINDGGGSISAKGVCWDTNPNPTINLSTKTTDGNGTSSFVSNINGLTNGVKYYLRAYATNEFGTSYGNDSNFISTITTVGRSFAGGIVFYIDATGQHGLVCSSVDQSSNIEWVKSSVITTGALGTAIGTGRANTDAIVKSQGNGSYAAQICNDLILNSYDDWFLPSKDELNLMYVNLKKNNIGNFSSFNQYEFYWSSSESHISQAWLQDFYDGRQDSGTKTLSWHVRAVRAF